MRKDFFSFESQKGAEIKYLRWLPDAKAKAVLQIVHGMAEHASRYDEFARFLNENAYAVYASDHLGHGLTAGCPENTGHFADSDGWNLVVNDCEKLNEIIRSEQAELPVFLLGHSMGSFITRDMISQNTKNFKGVILSGTSWNPYLLLVFGKMVAKIQKLFSGKKHRSKLLDNLSFSSFNSKFKPNRTAFDWLSCVPEFVDRYVKDEYCGFVCSAGFFDDMFGGIIKIQKNKVIRKTPSNLPVLLACGENDPVGNFTKGVKQLYKAYKNCRVKDIELKIYFQGRHEILNEVNRKEVYSDMLRWMDFRL
ncbi:MAG: alpha/beta hydrolase [Bacteroidota bacterium]